MKENKEKKQFLQHCIIDSMREKKALDITTLDLRALKNAVTDMFIICHGTSGTHIESIAKFIIENVSKTANEKPLVKEGFENREWILLDYFDFVIHVFIKEKRDFFALEKLWGDSIIKTYDNNLSKDNN
ncbi:MAG: ribosome silencing factor [Bacteroidota bacterium]|nr:ribosome silencing factor [Bacteroidota bacterium]